MEVQMQCSTGLRSTTVVVFVAVLLLAQIPCFSQAFTATLTGVFSDSTGAVVPGCKVQLLNTGTNEKRTTVAGSSGKYTFSQLLPGSYELSAEAPGFKRFVQQGITLRANETAELSGSLQVGAVNEQGEVTGSAPLLGNQKADQSLRLETP